MQTLTTQQVQDIHNKQNDVPLINVLPAEAYEKAHIPDSENIPMEATKDFTAVVEKRLGDKEKPVVVYCASKDCNASSKAAKELDAAGFSHVFDYEGGTRAWHEAGLTVQGTEPQSCAA